MKIENFIIIFLLISNVYFKDLNLTITILATYAFFIIKNYLEEYKNTKREMEEIKKDVNALKVEKFMRR